MDKPEEALLKLLQEGRYWQAIGMQPGSPSPHVILRLLDLHEQYPNLGVELNNAQTALTQQQAAYQQACGMRERIFQRIERSYGTDFFELMPRAGVWRLIWDGFIGLKTTSPEKVLARIDREIDTGVANLAVVGVSLREVRLGSAERTLYKSMCETCHGSQKMTCPNCKGSGRVTTPPPPSAFPAGLQPTPENIQRTLQWLRTTGMVAEAQLAKIEQMLREEDNPELKKTLLDMAQNLTSGSPRQYERPYVDTICPTCRGKHKVTCTCVRQVKIKIPSGMRSGWVRRVEDPVGKGPVADDEKTFVRLRFGLFTRETWQDWLSHGGVEQLSGWLIFLHPLGRLGWFSLLIAAGTILLMTGISASNQLYSMSQLWAEGWQSFVHITPIQTPGAWGMILYQALIMGILGVQLGVLHYYNNASEDYIGIRYFIPLLRPLFIPFTLGLVAAMGALAGLIGLVQAVRVPQLGLFFSSLYIGLVGGLVLWAAIRVRRE